MYAERHKTKISIIGAGAVGSAIAYALMLRGLADEIVFIDINEKLANAEMLDIKHGVKCIPDVDIFCGDYSDIKNSSMIIVTAGRGRKEGESRLDLTYDNLKITEEIACGIEKYYNCGIVLVVSNPVDIITCYLAKRLNLERGKVFGTGCILDTSRLSAIVSDYFERKLEIPVIGEHGSSQYALWNISGELDLSMPQKSAMEADVRAMGAEIIAGKGKTFYGIATCVCSVAQAVICDTPVELCVSVLLNGEYGIYDAALSIPCIVDSNGARVNENRRLPDEIITFLKKTAQNLNNTIPNAYRL